MMQFMNSASRMGPSGQILDEEIFGYTSVMDGQMWAYNFELVRNLVGLLFFIIRFNFNTFLFNYLFYIIKKVSQ